MLRKRDISSFVANANKSHKHANFIKRRTTYEMVAIEFVQQGDWNLIVFSVFLLPLLMKLT